MNAKPLATRHSRLKKKMAPRRGGIPARGLGRGLCGEGGLLRPPSPDATPQASDTLPASASQVAKSKSGAGGLHRGHA
jgi:hypothetical protein